MIAGKARKSGLQSVFYQQKFRKTIRWLIFTTFVILFLIFTNIYLVLFKHPQKYYANTTDGIILPMPEPQS